MANPIMGSQFRLRSPVRLYPATKAVTRVRTHSITKMIAGGCSSNAAVRVVVMSNIRLRAGRRSMHAGVPPSAFGQAATTCLQIAPEAVLERRLHRRRHQVDAQIRGADRVGLLHHQVAPADESRGRAREGE